MKDWLASFDGFEFASPWALALLVLLPLAAWWLGRRARVASIPFPSLKLLRVPGVVPRRASGRFRWLWTLLPLAVVILALARPRVPKGEIPDPTQGIDIMLALDYSGSMMERDFHLNGRLVSRREALASVVEKFVAKRPHDRIGIVGFARGPYLVCPLTLDHEWALAALREVDTAHGTAIGEALVAATHFLKQASERSKVIILVTDGQNSAGRHPAEVLPFPREEGVRVYSIVIGPERLLGRALNDSELLRVSRSTGGQLFQAGDTHMLVSVYDLIDRLEKKALVEKRFQQYRELHPWFAASALACLLLSGVNARLRRTIP